jgi:hypothetical protein
MFLSRHKRVLRDLDEVKARLAAINSVKPEK